eukprot:925245-Pelagomonas_calceolata.AAC.10
MLGTFCEGYVLRIRDVLVVLRAAKFVRLRKNAPSHSGMRERKEIKGCRELRSRVALCRTQATASSACCTSSPGQQLWSGLAVELSKAATRVATYAKRLHFRRTC